MTSSETSRRNILKFGAAAIPALGLGMALPATAGAATSPTGVQLRMPAEEGKHVRTFMAWPTLASVWPNLAGVRGDVARVAQQISRFEPVVMLAGPAHAAEARATCGTGGTFGISVIEIANDDLWIRDFGPTFLTGPGVIAGLDTNFNGWGKTGTTYYQPFANDAAAAATLLTQYGINRVQASFVGEGGSLETDGEGTLLATASSLVNPNRNPGKSQAQVEQDLKSSLGVDKVIWVPGLAGQDITDCHIDCLARFTAPGKVILDKPGPGADPTSVWSQVYDETKRILQTATDAKGRPLAITELPNPDRAKITGSGRAFLSSYTNYYTPNGAVIVPQFGDAAADAAARTILQGAYPGREVVQVTIDNIASGGGGIHCATQSQPVVPPAA
ncbi:agmatine deiminase family protein [Streptomyces sp. NPDC056361]|uniref:agmatine deiminase family protein n=1 Tax=Streptomyces sp. NPDC056361 TaxID=3345795 RepID=UPI0035DE62AC